MERIKFWSARLAMAIVTSGLACYYRGSRPHFGFGFFMFPFIGIFGLAGLAFWGYTLYEVLSREPEGSNEKLTWVLVVVLAGTIGAIVYWFVRRPKRVQETGK